MDKQAAIRRVRIAVSVFFGVLTVALCVLWVRSFWRMDQMSRSDTTYDVVCSNNGWVTWTRMSSNLRNYTPLMSWRYQSAAADGRLQDGLWVERRISTSVGAPHFVIALPFALMGCLPWAICRFSLRTMLIATTLVAVVLGLVCYAVR